MKQYGQLLFAVIVSVAVAASVAWLAHVWSEYKGSQIHYEMNNLPPTAYRYNPQHVPAPRRYSVDTWLSRFVIHKKITNMPRSTLRELLEAASRLGLRFIATNDGDPVLLEIASPEAPALLFMEGYPAMFDGMHLVVFSGGVEQKRVEMSAEKVLGFWKNSRNVGLGAIFYLQRGE